MASNIGEILGTQLEQGQALKINFSKYFSEDNSKEK